MVQNIQQSSVRDLDSQNQAQKLLCKITKTHIFFKSRKSHQFQLEHPKVSNAAHLWIFLSLTLILLSVLSFIAASALVSFVNFSL